jgi:hypothetical protein
MKHRVGGQGTNDVESFAPDLRNGGLKYFKLFATHMASFSGMMPNPEFYLMGRVPKVKS